MKREDLRPATQDEITWLDACIKADQFIPKEEALKSNNTQLVVGKWYRNNDSPSYIAKLAPANGKSFPCKEYIHANKYKKLYFISYFGDIWLKDSIEVPLSEIQQYLPDGHMDKIRVESTLTAYYEYIGESHKKFSKGKIYKINNKYNLEYELNFIDNTGSMNGYSGINHRYFKPSTKEAYDAQNTPKELIVKWSVDTYIVFIKDYGGSKIGNIDKIIAYEYRNLCDHIYTANEVIATCNLDYVKWFATLEEATNFSKTLNIVDKSQDVIIPKDFGKVKEILYMTGQDFFDINSVSKHNKSNDLQFQTPVILKSKKSKNKLIIINQ